MFLRPETKFISLSLIAPPLIAMILSFFAFQHIANNAERLTKNNLIALQSARKAELTSLLSSIEQDLSALTYSAYIRHAMHHFSNAWNELGNQATDELQKRYISNNPNPIGKKELLIDTHDNSLYNAIHKRYHPWFSHFLHIRNYYDIFLIDVNGNLVYSVFKENDFATNLLTGPWKDTDLAQSFKVSKENPQRNIQVFYDFKPYAPSNNEPASFISQPLLNKDQSLAGIISLQVPIDRINAIMQRYEGFGQTGESYLVGEDFLMRSRSRYSERSTILKKKVKNSAVELALNGHSGTLLLNTNNGIQNYVAYDYLDFSGTRWAIISEIAKKEIMEPLHIIYLFFIAINFLFITTTLIYGYLSHHPPHR